MPRFYGDKSRYLVVMEKINQYAALSYLLMLGFIAGGLITHPEYFKSIGQTLAAIIVFSPFVWFAYRRYKLHHREANNFRYGRRGEGAIYYELLKLPETYCIFQDVRLPNIGNIDFVVLGPTGLFTVEVKAHSGTIEFNGVELVRNSQPFSEKNILNQAFGEAIALNNYLEQATGLRIAIRPVIVFSSRWANMKFWMKPVSGVFVVQKLLLNKLLLNPPMNSALSPDQIAMLEEKIKYRCAIYSR